MTRSVSVTTAVRLWAPMIKSPHRVTGFEAFLDIGRTVTDGSDVTEWAAFCLFTAAAWLPPPAAARKPPPGAGGQATLTARLVTRLIDSLRAHQQKGTLVTEIGCYGVGRPSHPQPLGHSLGQLRIGDQFRDLRTPCPDLGLCLSILGSVNPPASRTVDLPPHRRRVTTQLVRYLPGRRSHPDHRRDHTPLIERKPRCHNRTPPPDGSRLYC